MNVGADIKLCYLKIRPIGVPYWLTVIENTAMLV
jgi:hypothetical protein